MVPGCLMVITDHINLFHRNPLAGTITPSPSSPVPLLTHSYHRDV
jgi:purine nucleoside phosphorylase